MFGAGALIRAPFLWIMAASASDKFKKLSRRWVGQIGSGGVTDDTTQTVPLSSTTNLPSDTAVVVVIDRVDANGTSTPSLEETVIGVVSGSNLANCIRGAEGTAQAHNAGAVVEVLVTAKGINDLIDGLLVEHDQDGTHNNITASSINLNSSTTITSIKDEDDMSSDSASAVPTQQSVKAYVDASGGGDGWTAYSAVTPTSGTLDDPTFELTFAGVDLTSTLQAGMRVKLTQSTVKYFIITKVAFSTNTTVTIYGGTDYDLVSTGTTVVSAFSYSSAKVPFGFPADPTKWTVRVTDTTERSQSSAVQDTWYNLGTTAAQISVPIGIWNTLFQVNAHISTNAQIFVALSTANNSASDSEFVATFINSAAAFGGSQLTRTKTLTTASKTTYYLNTKTTSSSTPTLYNRNDTTNGSPLIIEARCAYL